ncbi:MAG: penicillin-binding protein 2 [Leptolyngbyaceae bacterium]|nr:penicillin-binding protein 2 [Leptolyngbyaceae bacterium]
MTLIRNSPTVGTPNTRDSGRTVGQQFQSLVILLIVTLLFFGAIGSRLAYLQLIQGDRNRQLADDNRIRLLPRPPGRGRIFDRNGKVLVANRLSYAVYLWPIDNTEEEWQPILRKLSRVLNVPLEDIRERIEQAGYESPFLLRVARDISPAQLTALLEFQSQLRGVQVEPESERNYPNGDLAAHVLGYTGELSSEELEERKENGYRLGDIVGQLGVEAAFESQLRGEWGGQQVEVDGMGRVLEVIGEKPSISGDDVTLTLDLELQQIAENALGDRIGAVVAMDPRNGEVLAMVSRPTFDPNLFSSPITSSQWEELQKLDNPFVNRALQGYPPASTFKIVTTTAAIESGAFAPNTVLPTYPFVQVGGIQFWDWNKAGFGPLSFRGAMAWSSDTFFYQTARAMGHIPLIQWTRRYGFGRKTGIEIAAEEAAGLVPDEAWKREALNDIWYQGDTINMSIGQGYLLGSPLQVAVMFAVPANGGYLVKPHLLKDNGAAQNWREPVEMSPTTLRVVQEGLRDVITYGTGRGINDPTLPPISGKSGTAEDPPRLSHAWFGAYAPTDNPEILVVAFAENSGGGGSAVAAPMVKQVLDYYFKGEDTTPAATDN